MKLYLPGSLDIDEHIAEFPPVGIEDFDRDKLVYFLSLILSVAGNNKDIAGEESGWVPLYSRILSKRDRKYWMYLDYALGKMHPNQEDAKIIQTDGQYIPGIKSKSYAFVMKYANVYSLRPVEIGPKLSMKLNKDAEIKKKEAFKQYPELLKWFDKDKLKIDSVAAREYAMSLKDQRLVDRFKLQIKAMETEQRSGHEDGLIKNSVNKILPNPLTQYLSYIVNIDRLEDGDYYFSVDENVRRLHTNLTNLKSELRNFLTYEGKSLVSVDIKNCQPFLSVALFNPEFYAKDRIASGACLQEDSKSQAMSPPTKVTQALRRSQKFTLERVAHEIFCVLENTPIRFKTKQIEIPSSLERKRKAKFGSTHLISLIMYVKTLQLADREDVKSYIASVSEGVFYEISQKLIEQDTMFRFKNRKEVKEMMFTVLFTDNRYRGELKELFGNLYPTVYEFFSLIKTKDNSILPRLLQSMESWLILDRVCKRISTEKPKLPIFTIHDSIVTTEGNEDYIKSVMVSEITKFIHHKPSLEIEKYSPENPKLHKPKLV